MKLGLALLMRCVDKQRPRHPLALVFVPDARETDVVRCASKSRAALQSDRHQSATKMVDDDLFDGHWRDLAQTLGSDYGRPVRE